MINDPSYSLRAEIIREKGTNRGQFVRGQVDRYTWVDIGSSYLPADMVAAFLWPQLQQAEQITARRLAVWQTYHEAFAELESAERVRRPDSGSGCIHNAHLYYLLLPSIERRTAFIQSLKAGGIESRSHFVPLHDSPMGRKHGRVSGTMSHTTDLSERLVRLPLWMGVEKFQDAIIIRVKLAVT